MDSSRTTRTSVIAAVVVCVGSAAIPASAAPTGRIAFTVSSRNGAGSHIFSVAPDGSGLAQLTRGRSKDSSALISPNGQKIAFVRDKKVWVMDADGGHKHRLTHGRGAELPFAWSPDSRRIAYQTADRQGRALLRIVTLQGHLHRLTKRRSLIGGVAWSPDGRHVAASLEIEKNGNFELFTMDRSGSHKHRITHDPGLDISPTWGRAGIVYEHSSASHPRSSLRLKKIGRHPVTFIHFAHARPEAPRFSPDGHHVAFMRCRGTLCRLFAARADSSALHEIYSHDSTGGYSWSPDSRFVVVSSDPGDPPKDNELFVCRALSKGCRRLTRDRDDEFAPSWGPR